MNRLTDLQVLECSPELDTLFLQSSGMILPKIIMGFERKGWESVFQR